MDATITAADTAQRLRKELLSWPDLAEVYGPQLGNPDVYFLRFKMLDGATFSIELCKEVGESDA